jgi:hypothetical protein
LQLTDIPPAIPRPWPSHLDRSRLGYRSRARSGHPGR